MANDSELRETCRLMIEDLRKRVHEKNVIINENKEKLKTEKVFGKLLTNKVINDEVKNVKLMSDLFGKLLVINMNTGKKRVIIQPEFKNAVESLCASLSTKEVENFVKVFDNYIKCNIEEESKDFIYNLYCIDVMIKQLNLSDEVLNKADGETYSRAFEKIKAHNIESDKITINYDSKVRERELPAAEDKMIVKLLAMKKNGTLVLDKSTELIMDNIYSIRNAFVTRARINGVVNKITNLLNILENVENWNVLSVKSHLSKLVVKYNHELDKVNKYLDKYDFTSVKSQVERNEEEKQLTDQERIKMAFYEEMAFELERISHEEPDNLEYNIQLNKKMSSFAVNSGLTSVQLEKAHDNGVKRYSQEIAFMNEFKSGGKSLYNEYLEYCKNSKEKNKLTFVEYVKTYHGLDDLDSVVTVTDPGMKM